MSDGILFAGFASGEWGKADGSNKKLVTKTDNNNKDGFSSFEWGKPAYPKDLPDPNSLVFTNNRPFGVGLNEVFSLGELTYFNGSVNVNTVPDYVPLKIDLDFSTGPDKSPLFEYNLDLDTTNDDGVPDEDAWSDFVFFPEGSSRKDFTYNGKDYSLELMGFSTDEGKTIESQFRVREQDGASAELFAKITEAPKKPPRGDTDPTIEDAGSLKPRDDKDNKIGGTEGGVRDSVDYYEFTVKDYSQVTITLDDLERNANLDILDSNGRTVLFQSREEGDKREKIEEEFSAGTYYARIYPETINDITPYNLKITTSAIKDEKDSFESADDRGVLGWETTIEDQVGKKKGNRRDAADWYKFTLDEEKDVILTLDGMRGGNADVVLYKSDGETVVDTGDNKGRKAEKITARELAKGDYYVEVTPGPSPKDRPTYNLKLSALEIETDNDDTAPGIDLGVLMPDRTPLKNPAKSRIGGTKRRTDTTDFYKFSLAADSDVEVNIAGMRGRSGLNVNATLYRWEDGKLIEEVGDTVTQTKKKIVIEESQLEAGEYVLELEAGAGVNTPYNFRITAQPEYIDDYYPREDEDAPLDFGDITALAEGEKIEHQNRVGQPFGLNSRDQEDWFTFELTEEKDVTLKLRNLKGKVDMRLYEGDSPSPDWTNFKDPISLEAGKYYVEVRPGSGGRGNGSYRFELGVVDIIPKTDTIDIGSLTELSSFQKANQRIGGTKGQNKNTEDRFEFTIDGDDNPTVQIAATGLSRNVDLFLEEKVSGGFDAIGQKIEDEDKSEIIEATLDAGEYVAIVKSRGGEQSSYNFTANIIDSGAQDPDGDPPNFVNEIDDPANFPGTTDTVGSTSGGVRDENDYYEFTLTEKQDVSLSLESDRFVTLQLLEDNEDPRQSFTRVKEVDETFELEKGTYYINVGVSGGGTAEYTLNLNAGDVGKDVDGGPYNSEFVNEVGDLTNTEYVSDLDSIGFVEGVIPDEKDWYKFTTTEATEFVLNVNGLRETVDVRLRDRNGSLIKKESGSGDILLERDLNRTGDYYVEIASRGKGTAYELNMRADTAGPDDGNNSLEEADPLTNPVNVSSSVGSNGDPVDWYKFTADRTGSPNVTLDTRGGSAEANLYDSNEFPIGFLQSGQEYFVAVASTSSSTSFYDLSVV